MSRWIRTRHHHRPARPCVASFEVAGPHPGCAEFAAPDVFSCNQPATHRYTYVDAWGGGERERGDLCPFHAALESAPGFRAYRFRRTPAGTRS